VDDDLVAVLVEPGGVAPEDHRQRLLLQPHPAQRPEVVVVERGGLDGDRGPPVGDLRIGPFPDHEAGERVVAGGAVGIDGEHAHDPSQARSDVESPLVRVESPPVRVESPLVRD
jgi:hypothetical protein